VFRLPGRKLGTDSVCVWHGESSLCNYTVPEVTRTGRIACATKAHANGKLSHYRKPRELHGAARGCYTFPYGRAQGTAQIVKELCEL
jgi:hypothetical protein